MVYSAGVFDVVWDSLGAAVGDGRNEVLRLLTHMLCGWERFSLFEQPDLARFTEAAAHMWSKKSLEGASPTLYSRYLQVGYRRVSPCSLGAGGQ